MSASEKVVPLPASTRSGASPFDAGVHNFLLEHYSLIHGTDTVYDDSEAIFMKVSAMAHSHGSEAVKLWKGSPSRRTVQQRNVVFDPTGACDPLECLNLFRGIALVPKRGDVGPMLKLARHLVGRAAEHTDDVDQILHWLLCWLAYPLQHLGAKLRTAVVMHGDEGAGKNFLTDTMVAIYGEYGSTVGQDELEDKFNDWRSRKLFIVGDEVSSRQELVHNKNRLKALITSPTVQINPKNLPRREEANHINVWFNSNELQPLALDNTDRRYLVIYTPPPLERDFYRSLGEWRGNDGLQAWYHYLLKYTLDDFDPYAPAPITQAKRDLIELNRKSPERFWAEWSGGELDDLPYWPCTVDQAYRAYAKYCQRVGERYPAQKAIFSRMVVRVSESLQKPLRQKQMRVADRVARMLLPVEPPEQGQGEWADAGVRAFEAELGNYLRGPHSPVGGEP
jgi:putative DNA primase/helicase